ncbi:hypothetical protein [Natronobeatus ordinarius]|uniref:hypothetical protein n=1 Tax=Natronobeatus ordinarius TaxID=2963433 RepID=UPI0020CFE070|nr:hypothetical protein [Natronobeatus ordinarius]
MRLTIPGLPGVYYDTDARSTALTVAFTLAGRRAPKPQGYGLQLLPYVWSFDVDLREVPADHPFQYLHPEGARSLEELSRGDLDGEVSRELDRALRFAWAVNEETEGAFEQLLGVERREDGVVIEIDEGALEEATDGDLEDLEAVHEGGPETDEFRPDELGEDGAKDDADTETDEFRPDELDD